MPKIIITAEAEAAIRAEANNLDERGALRRPDGRWEIKIDDEVAARLAGLAYPGETISDTIIRGIQAMKGSTH